MMITLADKILQNTHETSGSHGVSRLDNWEETKFMSCECRYAMCEQVVHLVESI
jgi:hypothetical protein